MFNTFDIRPARATDADYVGNLAKQFAGYLRSLGDTTDFKLTAEAYLRDGFGSQPAFGGLVAEDKDRVIGYLLYHIGYDSDAAARNLHIVDLYVDSRARKRGAGRALLETAASVARNAGARELIWSVYRANGLATTFYEKLGAQRITDVFFMKLSADAL
ncbi:MAG TPA: GNAT family N-acetyltransferase [Candidatus Angelobacter sp.]|nr:GNAT family N-acetyltransferase [Candidatus Angelobacter sp.]